MSRNNSDRMGGTNIDHTGASDAPPTALEEAQGQRGPLDFSIPTEFVDLPSEGRYYPENHPLHSKETVEIKYMTAKEEDILTSPSLLKKGLTIDRLLRSILIDKTIDPQETFNPRTTPPASPPAADAAALPRAQPGVEPLPCSPPAPSSARPPGNAVNNAQHMKCSPKRPTTPY